MLIAACGLICSDCDAYQATQADDAEWVARIARKWSEHYGTEVKPEQVWCDGCLARSGRIFGSDPDCVIRPCVLTRGIQNCAQCKDYDTCGKLSGFFQKAPKAKNVLDGIRMKWTGK